MFADLFSAQINLSADRIRVILYIIPTEIYENLVFKTFLGTKEKNSKLNSVIIAC